MSSLLQQTQATHNLVSPGYSVVVLGDGGVGKSALTVRFCFDNFLDEYGMNIYLIIDLNLASYIFILLPQIPR